jgi:hypothetical protein
MFSSGKKPSVTGYIDEYSSQSSELKQHAAALNTNDLEAIKAAIGKYDEDMAGRLEGASKEDILAVRDKLLSGINEGVASLDERINELGDLNEGQIANYHYNRYAQNTVSDMVKPYAHARSRQKMKLDLKVVDDVLFKHKLDLQKQNRRFKHERMMADYEFKLNNPRMDVRKKGSALHFERPGGVSYNEANSAIKNNTQQLNKTRDGILQAMYDHKYEGNPSAPSFGKFRKDFFANSGFTAEDMKNAQAQVINGQTVMSVIGADGKVKSVPVQGMSASALNREFQAMRNIDKKNKLIDQRKQATYNKALHNLRNEGKISDKDIEMYQNMKNVSPEQEAKIKEAYAVYEQNFSTYAGGGILGLTVGNVINMFASDENRFTRFQTPNEA